jgi:fumarylacetoacetate (FAA) hydrolase family protein
MTAEKFDPAILPSDAERATLVGRVYRPGLGASVIVVRGGEVFDITRSVRTVSALLEADDPVEIAANKADEHVGDLASLLASSADQFGSAHHLHLLAPCDLQPIKACGVTFANSLMERIIEERADGDFTKADQIRTEISEAIGADLANLKPGSPEAGLAKEEFIRIGLWSQYLEVGIGPDAEVFTKAPPMSSVGHGWEVGVHPMSTWNNPEPEIVLAVNSRGKAVGAALGNDVNLRDVEGRSALLLGKAKDNNGSCAIGPFIRLFDDDYNLDDVRTAELQLRIRGLDGYELTGTSFMSKISRDPLDLVSQTIGAHHQYPDGVLLFLGTLFAPTQDRDDTGCGFTHKIGDQVEIWSEGLGTLVNTVAHTDSTRRWEYGLTALFNDLIRRDLG